jgi:SAM-dependent methyltransferase
MIQFDPCEICGADQWASAYHGSIRDGAFGSLAEKAEVRQCGGCGVERLAENFCLPESAYSTAEYRQKLKQGLDSQDYLKTHDPLQLHTLRVAQSLPLRDSIVADAGCAGGSLLDHVRGTTTEQVAIEPCDIYHERLAAQGYHVFPDLIQATGKWAGRVEVAFSIHVVEHVPNPRSFLEAIRTLMAPGGRMVLATPNRRDLLLDLLPDDYPQFFYRVVHRWYFDADSLADCARRAGWEVEAVKPVQRYGLSNTLRWLRDKAPGGAEGLPGINAGADDWWKSHLETEGRAECLYLILKNPRQE